MVPGRHVTLVLDTDLVREEIVVRNSIIYDVIGDKVIVSQTEPQIPLRDLGRIILLTYVEKVGEKKRRLAVKTRIEEFIRDYVLSKENKVGAILLRVLSEPFESNLRRFFRVLVPSRSNIRLLVGEEEFSLLDISVGGCSILTKKVSGLPEGKKIKISLFRDHERVDLKANILRLVPLGSQEKGLTYQVCLEFVEVSPELKRYLTSLVHELEKTSSQSLTKD